MRRRSAAIAVAAIASTVALARAARAEDVGITVRSVLADKRYRFCHEDDYPLAPDEHQWCPLLGDISGACPSLPKACKLPAVDRMVSLPFSFGRSRSRHAKGGDLAPRPETEDARQRPAACSPPRSGADLSLLSSAARFVFFAMIVVFVIAVVRLVTKNLVRRPRRPEDEPEARPPVSSEVAQAPRGPVETDVERLLNRARAAATRGDYQRAVDDTYAALLRRLDGDGLIEIHPSRTNGDYVRALADRPDLRAAVRAIVREVEDIQFGSRAPSDATFRSVLERVVPIATRVAGAALLLFGLGAVMACGDSSGNGDSGFADTSPSGTQAVIDVMSKHGITVRRRSESLAKLEKPQGLVLYPDAVLEEEAWTHVLDWVRTDGGTLVLAGLSPLPPAIEQRIADDSETATRLTVAPHKRWAGHPTVSLPDGKAVVPATSPVDGGSLEGPRIVEGAVLLRGASAAVTERSFGEGRIVMVADERLLMNAALVLDDDAAFVLSLLYRSAVGPDHLIELVDAWTGAGSRSPIEAIDRANLTPFILQLFVLITLLFLWKGRAFARLRDPPAETRRAFVDHARALGDAYRRSQSSRHVAGLYAVWAIERLRERLHRGGRQGLISLAEAIAARTGKAEGAVMQVLVEASGARDEAAPPSSFRTTSTPGAAPRAAGPQQTEADLALMQQLWSFLAATGSRRAATPNAPTPPEPSPEKPESR